MPPADGAPDDGAPDDDGSTEVPRWVQAIEAHLGHIVVAVTAVRDDEWKRRRRRSMTRRSLFAAAAVVLATVAGPGWLVLIALPVAHLLAFEPRRVLVATPVGLTVLEVVARQVRTVCVLGLGTAATLTLARDKPWVAVTVQPAAGARLAAADHGDSEPWDGEVEGTKLTAFEATVRAGGGEPVRRVA